MPACSSAMRVKRRIYVTRRAVVGRAGTSKPTIGAAIAVGDIVNKLSGRTVRELRRVICGGASAAKRRMAWRPSNATTGTGTCARGRLLPIGTRPDLGQAEARRGPVEGRFSPLSASMRDSLVELWVQRKRVEGLSKGKLRNYEKRVRDYGVGLELADGDSDNDEDEDPAWRRGDAIKLRRLAAATRNSGSGFSVVPQRVLAERPFSIDGRATKTRDLLVKWRGRPYDESSLGARVRSGSVRHVVPRGL